MFLDNDSDTLREVHPTIVGGLALQQAAHKRLPIPITSPQLSANSVAQSCSVLARSSLSHRGVQFGFSVRESYVCLFLGPMLLSCIADQEAPTAARESRVDVAYASPNLQIL